jgi:hypothetical protein
MEYGVVYCGLRLGDVSTELAAFIFRASRSSVQTTGYHVLENAAHEKIRFPQSYPLFGLGVILGSRH